MLCGLSTPNNAQISDGLAFPTICRLAEVGRAIEPFSCWCISRPKAHLCHIINPDLHLPQNVKDRCGTDTACCLKQVVIGARENVSTNTTANITNTTNDLSSFARFIIDYFALCNKSEKNIDAKSRGSLFDEPTKDSIPGSTKYVPSTTLVPALPGLSPAGSETKSLLETNDAELPGDYPESGFPGEAGNESASVQGKLFGFSHLYKSNESNVSLLDLGDIASSLLIQTNHLSKRSLNDTNVWLKTFSLLVSFINNTVSNRIHNANATGSGLDKNDIVGDYNKLGWLSKAVEAAIDISLYAGVALGIMYLTGTLLSGFISSVWNTCFICYFAENFDLVPVSPNL
ncbi:uncharacterized protein [Macrobrachium rosenbergii]|uniref:uncharacterized protein n=1 Tax=Macrobrachium rosenbergii TaxID=79674 RepID=UPI0034D751F2